MKKSFSALLGAIFLFVTSACSVQPGQPGTQQADDGKITFNYETTANDLDYFAENDDIITILASTPYYNGSQTINIPAYQKFTDLKKTKVDEAIKLTGELYVSVKDLEKEIAVYKAAYIDFMSQAMKEEKKLNKFGKESAQQFIEFLVKEGVIKARIDVLASSIPSDPYSRSFLEYEKTSLVLQLADTLNRDLAYLLGNSAQLASVFANTENAAIKSSLAEFNTRMEKVSELNDTLTAIDQQTSSIDLALKQINTAEYYMAQASLGFVTENLPDLKEKVASLQPSEQLTKEDIAFMDQYLDEFGNFAGGLQTELAAIDQNELIEGMEKNQDSALVPVAYAGFSDNLSKAYDTLKAGASATAGAAKLTWKGVQTAAGMSLDVLSAHTKSVFDVGFGLYNGNRIKEIASEVGRNYVQVLKNLDAGTSGSKILRTAGEYLDNVETGFRDYAQEKAEKVAGKGWTSWLVGQTAKLTAGMFTGLGKGIYKVANKTSNTPEYAEGLLDVGFAFVGGSKIVVKGSQILSGGAKTAPLVAENGANFISRVWNNVNLSSLQKGYAEWVKKTGPENIQLVLEAFGKAIDKRKVLGETLQNVAKEIDKKFIELLKGGWQNVKTNLTTGVKESFSEFVEQGFDDSLKGIKQAIDTVTGKTVTDYFDNVFGGALDDLIKDQVKDAVASFPGTAPALKDLAGTWNQGQMLIKDIHISDEFRKEAEKEGCDIEEIERKEGTTQNIGMSLAPSSDNAGMMTIVMDGKPQEVPFTYTDGTITSSYEKDGMTMTFNMKVTEENNAYKVSGPMVVSSAGDFMKISADTSASKTFPPPPAPPAPTQP